MQCLTSITMAKKEKITVKKIDDAKKAKKGSEEKEAKPAKVRSWACDSGPRLLSAQMYYGCK